MSKIPKDIKDLLFYIELQQKQAQTELSQFYEKYYKMVMAIKNDKSINALCEMQGGTYAN